MFDEMLSLITSFSMIGIQKPFHFRGIATIRKGTSIVSELTWCFHHWISTTRQLHAWYRAPLCVLKSLFQIWIEDPYKFSKYAIMISQLCFQYYDMTCFTSFLLCYSYFLSMLISASQMKSIATKMLWGFTFVPRTPKITTFWNSEAAPCTEALFCF